MTSRWSEVLMGPGSFQVDLVADVPPSVLAQVTVDDTSSARAWDYATVVVTDAPVDVDAIAASSFDAAHPIQEDARWAGVLTSVSGPGRQRTLSGHGLAWWLWAVPYTFWIDGSSQDPDQVVAWDVRIDSAEWFELLAIGGTAGAMGSSDTVRVSGCGLHDARSNGVSPPLPPPGHFFRLRQVECRAQPRAEILADIAATRRWMWWVNPQGILRYGPPVTVWSQQRVVIGADLADDPKWVVVDAEPASDHEEDLDDQATRYHGIADWGGFGRHLFTGGRRAIGAGPRNTSGLVLRRGRLSDLTSDERSLGTGDQYPEWETRVDSLGSTGGWQVARRVTTVGRPLGSAPVVRPGERCWIYDPTVALVDPTRTNQVIVGGQTIWPVSQQILGVTSPIAEGMGVYVVYWDRTAGAVRRVFDLTPYVKFAPADAQVEFEVGKLTTGVRAA